MVLELRRNEVEDHFVGYICKKGKVVLEENVSPSMEMYLNMGLDIIKFVGIWIGRSIYNLFRKVHLMMKTHGTLIVEP